MKRHKLINLIILAAMLALGGCGDGLLLPAAQSLPTESSSAASSTPERSENSLSDGQSLSHETAAESSTSGQPEDIPVTLDILTSIQLEAGVSEITAADLFEEYNAQQVTFRTFLSAEELAMAGATYQVDVIYLNQPVTVTVEIVDTTPPTIEGVKALSVDAGASLSYKKDILLSDNAAGEILLEIDNSLVDLNVPGTYPIRYTATDGSGNQSAADTTVTVNAAHVPTEEDAYALADTLIAQIITPEMSKYDTAYTLWNWCRTNIRYAASAENYSSVWAGAYEGLQKKSGDCYTYYATYSLLLTRCGIDNLCVARTGGISDHWWNLVNVGDGWYHCDSSPRRRGDPYLCFMQTDAQVQAYTESYPDIPNYYVFDGSLYPDRETVVIFGDDPAASTDSEQ